MKRSRTNSRLCLYACAALVGGLGAACSSVTPSSPPATASRVVAAPAGSALLYVSEPNAHRVLMYSYPGLKRRGEIDGLRGPTGMCVDARTQNVWIVDSLRQQMLEFAHGGRSPIRTLRLGGPYVDSCAVDPTSGAIAAATTYYDNARGLLVFAPGSKKPTLYQNHHIYYYAFVGYDDSGDAFVDGFEYGFHLAELPSGGDKLKIVPTNQLRIPHPGNVQFDGTGLAIGAERHGLVYRVSGGTLVGTTRLSGACFVQQFYVDVASARIVAPNVCKNKGEIAIYDYPAGGAPVATIAGLSYPFGAVISR